MSRIHCFRYNRKALSYTILSFVEAFPCCSRVYSTSKFNIGLIQKRIGKVVCQRFFGTSGQKNLYEILEVNQSASQDELKSAFYKLSKKYHPDVSGSSEESNKKFVEISNAYETLKDEKKRREYDLQLAGGYRRPESTARERGQPTWSTDFHPRPPFKTQQWEREWKWQFGGSERQRKRPFSPFDDLFGGPPPRDASPFERWQWDQERVRRQWTEWEWGQEIERRKREEKELNEVCIL